MTTQLLDGSLRDAARGLRRSLDKRIRRTREALIRLRTPTVSREEFLAGLRGAVEAGRGYAAGKNGRCEQYWMYYEIFLQGDPGPEEVAAYHEGLVYNGLRQTGIFPADPSFYLDYSRFYAEHLRNLDSLGVCYCATEPEILRHYEVDVPLIHYPLQEPDRSVPDDEGNCYLPSFRDKRLLIVCPFAGFLADRAEGETFEAVWAKTGKKWFHPRSVDHLEFPYGFEPATWERYDTAIDLYEELAAEMGRREFDVALIAAAGLAIPLASHAKNLGRVGIDLGGHLQVLFGVLGGRWRTWEWFRETYVTDAWVDLPERYRPARTDVCDGGAYW